MTPPHLPLPLAYADPALILAPLRSALALKAKGQGGHVAAAEAIGHFRRNPSAMRGFTASALEVCSWCKGLCAMGYRKLQESFMTVRSASQLMIDFTPGLTERHALLTDCVRECAYTHRNPLKTLAADMDMSQSELSRKLANNPDDPRRLSVEDLVRFIDASGDTTPIQWLIERFMQDDGMRQRRAMAELVKHMPNILALFKQAASSI